MLILSRNIFFYNQLSLKDTFETRIYLMFLHYSIILIILKKKEYSPDQENYNNLFISVENNLREIGTGDVSVNKKMKDLNKLFYDILIKISKKDDKFELNRDLIARYFEIFSKNDEKWEKCQFYFNKFYDYCFEISPSSIINDIKYFKLN